MVRDARKQGLKAPVLLMGYYNPIRAYGEEKALQDCKAAGVNGFILVDLPPEEAVSFRKLCSKAGYESHISPSSPLGDVGDAYHVLWRVGYPTCRFLPPRRPLPAWRSCASSPTRSSTSFLGKASPAPKGHKTPTSRTSSPGSRNIAVTRRWRLAKTCRPGNTSLR